MKKIALIIILLSFSASVTAQKSRRKPPPPGSVNLDLGNDVCAKNHHFSAVQRRKNFPFDTAAGIVLVSFNYHTDAGILDAAGLALDTMESITGLPIKDNRLDDRKLIEKINLDSNQVNNLTDILYNYDYKGNDNFVSQHACYAPRNAIVFLDKAEDIIGYIEICFECERFVSEPHKIEPINFCNGKYEMLRQLFIELGIKKGTVID